MTETKRPRILIVTGVLWIGGGAEKVAAKLGNYLTEQGYETHLLTFYEASEKYPYHGVYHSFNETPKRHRLLKVFGIPLRVWRIARYVKQQQIDVAYTFLEEANFYTLVAKLVFCRSLSVIVSVRNNIRTRGTLFQKLCAWLYPHARAVVSVTKLVETMLIEDFALTNTTTIYNSLDMTYIDKQRRVPLPPAYQWLQTASPLCISIGRLIHQKGQWHMIRAFTAVVAQYPNAQLVLIGSGEYEAKIKQLIADCELRDSVHLLGKHANVYQFLQAADLFVFSSLFEGMPNTVLEALSVGLPIVSPDCPSGPREILAPGVAVTESLQYPHETAYGILTEPHPIIEPVWDTPHTTPLNTAEQQIADAVCHMLERGWTHGPTYTAYTNRVAEAFSYQTIMQEWEALLSVQSGGVSQ